MDEEKVIKKIKRPAYGGALVVQTILITFAVIALSVTLMTKRDSQATSMTTKVLLNALNPSAEDRAGFFTVWDVSKYIRDKLYPTYLKCFLDSGGRLKKNNAEFDPRHNFTAFGAYNLLSPLRLRQMRMAEGSGCPSRPKKFDVLPCIPDFDPGRIYTGFMNMITTLWIRPVSFEYRKAPISSSIRGVMQDSTGASLYYPNEGHIYYPDINASVHLLDALSWSRAMVINLRALAANLTFTADIVASILEELRTTDDDLLQASTIGLIDLLAGPEGYQQNNNPFAPKQKAFLSEYTRVLFVEMDVLNANRNNPSAASVILMFEFSPYGGVYVSFKIQPFTYIFEATPLDYGVIVLMVLWLVTHVIVAVVKIRDESTGDDKEITTVWTYLRGCCTHETCMLITNLSLFSHYVRMCNYLQGPIQEKVDNYLTWKTHPNLGPAPPFPDFGDIYADLDSLYTLAAVILLFAATNVIWFLGTYEIFGRYIRLASAGFGLLASFSVLFLIAVVFFAMCMHLQLAPRVDGFEDVGQSILSTFRMLVGDMPFDIKKDDIANVPTFAMVSYVCFTVLYMWIALNVFIAIVSKAHELALESAPDMTAEEAVVDFLEWARAKITGNNMEKDETKRPTAPDTTHQQEERDIPPLASHHPLAEFETKYNPILGKQHNYGTNQWLSSSSTSTAELALLFRAIIEQEFDKRFGGSNTVFTEQPSGRQRYMSEGVISLEPEII
eukprot:PhF_6_TR43379/c0_g1_i1/m.66553/K04986/PKD2; polycystin 2